MGLSSHGRRRRRAVDGEQLLALGAAAVAEAGWEARAEAGRAKEDGVGRAAVVVLVAGAYEQPNAPAHPDLPHYSIRAERRRADQRAELAKACASSDAPTEATRGSSSAIFFSCGLLVSYRPLGAAFQSGAQAAPRGRFSH